MEDVSPLLTKSFASHLGTRGVHFYDTNQCEFLEWNVVMSKLKEKFPDQFYDRLIEAVANYNPKNEFVTVTAGGGQLTIELFKAEAM